MKKNVLHKMSWLVLSALMLITSALWAAQAPAPETAFAQPIVEPVDLMQVYSQAERSDPAFQKARATMLADMEVWPQARAVLLPQISGSIQELANKRKITDAPFGGPPSEVSYGSYNYSLNASQPIFNFALWMQLKSAGATVKQAQATFDAAKQDLMIRVAKAYFNVLQAADDVTYSQAQERANAKQLDQVQQRFKVGVDAITSVYDAQAAYDAARAVTIAAENTLKNAREQLREITGRYYTHLAPLNSARLPLVVPEPVNVDTWVQTAIHQNFTLKAAKYAAQAAHDNIRVNFGGHLPTVSAIAQLQKQHTGNTQGPNSSLTSETELIGIQVNVPLFQGGLINSQTRQAKYRYEQASADVEGIYRNVVVTTRQAYNNILSGISQIEADRQAVKSNESSVESSEASLQVGTRTIVDVLIAEKNLFQARQALAQDQYTYINAILALRQAAGTLSPSDLATVNSWLKVTR